MNVAFCYTSIRYAIQCILFTPTLTVMSSVLFYCPSACLRCQPKCSLCTVRVCVCVSVLMKLNEKCEMASWLAKHFHISIVVASLVEVMRLNRAAHSTQNQTQLRMSENDEKKQQKLLRKKKHRQREKNARRAEKAQQEPKQITIFLLRSFSACGLLCHFSFSSRIDKPLFKRFQCY